MSEAKGFTIRYRINNGKIRLEYALGIYNSTTKNVLQWCDSTTPILRQVINGSDAEKSQPLESLLASTLNDGVQIMSTARTVISFNNFNFRTVIRDIGNVLIRITADLDGKTVNFKEENRELYENLKNKIRILNNNVNNFKSQLRFEIVSIDDIRAQIGFLHTILALNVQSELRDEITSSIEKLIAECNGYHKRHELA